jgi:16S rRNA (guanine527-N7)-methyltransferase
MTNKTPAAALSPETIRRALAEFQVTVDDLQVEQIQQYTKILLAWNEKVNLTAIRDPLEILHRHFCESMFAGPAIPVERGRLADVGSGGGFPGLPLKIVRPELQLFLIESNIKKATFLAETVRELGLADARVLVGRYQEFREEVAPLDFVCSRALGEFQPFLEWAAEPSVAADRAVLWIGARDLDEVRKIPAWEWQEPIPVPNSLRRLLLVGKKPAVPPTPPTEAH